MKKRQAPPAHTEVSFWLVSRLKQMEREINQTYKMGKGQSSLDVQPEMLRYPALH
jgi:hypothetical protein